MWPEGERCPQNSAFSNGALNKRERTSSDYKEEVLKEVLIREIQRERRYVF